MDAQAVREYSKACAQYLEEEMVYDLFETMLKEVVLAQPEDPLQFFIDYLKKDKTLRVVLVGPPGSKRSLFAEKLAKEYKCTHLNAGQLIKEALKNDGEALTELESGLFARDDVAIKAVMGALEKVGSGSWVLEGFPRTRVQALALQSAKMSPDKFLLLNVVDGDITKAYESKPSANPDGVERRLQQYKRHLLHTVEVYQHLVMQLDITGKTEGVVFEDLKHLVSLKEKSNAPLRPARVCVLGPLGAGRTTLSKQLAAHYGAVHVDIASIVRQMKEQGEVGSDVLVDAVPDVDLCRALRARLEQIDCSSKGWILDGFPMNRQQSEFLKGVHFAPTRVVQIAITLEECVRRLASRKYDPVTGKAYYGPPQNVAMRQRLVQDKHDNAEAVKARFDKHANCVQEVLTFFSSVVTTLKGDESPQTLLEQAQSFIDRPLAH
jgi:adenylate kinase